MKDHQYTCFMQRTQFCDNTDKSWNDSRTQRGFHTILCLGGNAGCSDHTECLKILELTDF